MERVLGHVCRNALPPGYADAPSRAGGDRRGARRRPGRPARRRPGRGRPRGFGRPAGFVERQLRRWSQQWEASRTGELPALDALRDELVRTLPPQRAAAIVHGDYRLDNTILHPTSPGRIVAVLDWEMSTLGDPLTDLGTLLAYWSEETDDAVLAAARVMAPVTAADGFPSRAEVVEPLRGADGLRRLRRRVVPGVRVLQARRRLPGDRRARRGRRDARLRLRRGPAPGGAARRGGPAAGRRRLSASARQAPDRERPVEQPDPPRSATGSSDGHPAVDAQDVTGHEAAPGPSRNSTASSSSPARPPRPSGVRSSRNGGKASGSSPSSAVISEAKKPGATALTRIP